MNRQPYFRPGYQLIGLPYTVIFNNQGNIWGNLQPSDRPGRLSWDLTNGSDWLPLFGRQMTNPGLPSVQPLQVAFTASGKYTDVLQTKVKKFRNFSSSDHRAAKQLKERLERVLRFIKIFQAFKLCQWKKKTSSQRYSHDSEEEAQPENNNELSG